MRILYAGMKYDYGRPEQGFGFEHYNFYDSLRHMGHDIVYFDYMTLLQKHGRDGMNRRLLDVSRAEKPDVMMTVLFKDEFDPLVLREISAAIPTVNWFCDDHWRFDNYSCQWASCFTWVVTTAVSALPKYAALGHRHVIKSQWACNQFLYRKLDLPLRYDVTFVGQPHGNRRSIIDALRRAGVRVHVWGAGWESGRISQDDMIRVFNQSRINLNLANASVPTTGVASQPDPLPAVFHSGLRARLSRAVDKVPFGSRMKAVARAWRGTPGHDASMLESPVAVDANEGAYSEQIKGRNFEVPGCGGFVLTGRADNLEQYYDNGTEIVCFDNRDDLIDKIRYYLAHERERAEIAQAGYDRTLREHTYTHRFTEIFSRMGMPASPNAENRPGVTLEVE